MCDLYDSSDAVEYILPLAMRLLVDRVADVRQAALSLVSPLYHWYVLLYHWYVLNLCKLTIGIIILSNV